MCTLLIIKMGDVTAILSEVTVLLVLNTLILIIALAISSAALKSLFIVDAFFRFLKATTNIGKQTPEASASGEVYQARAETMLIWTSFSLSSAILAVALYSVVEPDDYFKQLDTLGTTIKTFVSILVARSATLAGWYFFIGMCMPKRLSRFFHHVIGYIQCIPWVPPTIILLVEVVRYAVAQGDFEVYVQYAPPLYTYRGVTDYLYTLWFCGSQPYELSPSFTTSYLLQSIANDRLNIDIKGERRWAATPDGKSIGTGDPPALNHMSFTQLQPWLISDTLVLLLHLFPGTFRIPPSGLNKADEPAILTRTRTLLEQAHHTHSTFNE